MADKKISLIEIAGDDQSSQKNAKGFVVFGEAHAVICCGFSTK